MALYDIAAGLRPLDLGRALAQADAMQANRLQADALRENLAQGRAFQEALAQHGEGAGRGEEGALLALARTPQGFHIAAPLLRERRQNAEAEALLRTLGLAPGANAPAVAQGGPPVAPRAPGATPAASAPLPGLAGVPEQWRGAVEASARLRGVDPDDLANLLSVESGWNPNAVSPRGAVGLGQHMPGTASDLGIDPRDPQQSIDGAARYLAQQQQRFGREGGFAAYNAGPGRVQGATQNGEINLAALPAETQQYTTRLSGGGGQPLGGAALDVSRGTGLPAGINATTLAALAASGNPRLQAVAQILAPMMRQADAPDRELVQVVGPNGAPVLVPRAQAVGRTPYISGQDAEPYRPMTPDERRAYGVPNNVSAAIGVRTNRPLISGPGQQNFNMGEREADKQAGAAFETAQTAASAAGRRAPIYAMMDAALAEFRPGIDANARIAVGQGLRALGIRTAETSQGEVLRALQRRLELAVTPQGQGAITENERTLIRDQVNVLGSTPEGARMLLQAVRQLDDYDRRFATILTDEVRKAGGQINALVMADARERAARELGPPLSPDVASAILSADRGESSATPANGPGGQGIAEPPAAAPVRVRTPAEAQQLPPGTLYIAPDGQTRRR